MRFHHSTRRGRTKFSQGGGPHQRGAAGHSAISNRWAQLSYCRQTNIHFNRRLPVEVPESARNLAGSGQAGASALATDQIDELLESEAAFGRRDSLQPQQQQQQRRPNGSATSGELITSQMAELSLVGGAGEQHRTSTTTTNSDTEQENASGAGSGAKRRSKLKMGGHARRWPRQADKRASLTGQQREEDPANVGEHLKQTAPKKLDIEGAREKLIAQVEKHPFWSNKAARRMRLLDLVERRIFIYELVSHCEKRDLEWRYEPYRGGLVAGSGPFAAAATTTTTSGVRRVLSSVGERQPPTSLLIDSNNNETQSPPSTNSSNLNVVRPLKARLQTGVAHSQPASPMMPSNSILQPASLTAPVGGGRDEQFVYDTDEQGQLTPPSSVAAGHQKMQQSAAALRRQTIRRSCSSAATSPSHQSIGQLASGSSIGSLAEATAPSWGEPRPLPSAELVWSIEPPAHLRPTPFASYIHTTEVPDTSFVKRCHGCQGRGRLKCTSCYGVGYEVCISCSGKGTMKSLSSGVGASSTSGSHARLSGTRSGGGGAESSTVGSMWSNAESSSASESRLGSGRYDEPGGVTGGSSGLGSGGGSAWTTESCHFCHGAGQKRCWICAGRSYNTCTACAGTGQLRCFLNLNITWMNHRDEFVLNNSDAIIPRDRLKLSSGLLLAEEAGWRLAPLAPTVGATTTPAGRHQHQHQQPSCSRPGGVASNSLNSAKSPTTPTKSQQDALNNNSNCNSNSNSPSNSKPARPPIDQLVKPAELAQLQAASAKLLERHWAAYGQSERLLRQRHRVTQIECHLVNWEWKRRRGHFVIYGDERKVYIAKYPFKSICNIT